MDKATADYRDHATMLELAFIKNEPDVAGEHLGNALAAVREPWEPQTTENNLQIIAEARRSRGVQTDWLDKIIKALQQKQNSMR